MKIKLYQIDAFSNEVFSGNPAAVCPLDKWLDDDVLQNIALENNLSETAFFIKQSDGFELRWFTPKVEVDLCGHATLATSFVIFNLMDHEANEIKYYTRKGGVLTVRKDRGLIVMNFPSRPPLKTSTPRGLIEALGVSPIEVLKSRDYLVVLGTEEEIVQANPNFNALLKIEDCKVIISAKGNNVDFVSRFFAPSVGVNEDPVTGSAHCTLIPYWAKKMEKNELHAVQLSQRKGELFCKYLGDRVEIAGRAVKYLEGEIEI